MRKVIEFDAVAVADPDSPEHATSDVKLDGREYHLFDYNLWYGNPIKLQIGKRYRVTVEEIPEKEEVHGEN